MRNLISFFSYRSFIVGAGGLGLGLAWLLARDGFALADSGILLLYLGLCVGLYLALRTPQIKITAFDELAAFDRVLREGRPTLLEFYSDQCAASMLNRMLMDGLEREAGHRLQILCVNARDSLIGKTLADRYGVTFTPTFILFNERGQQEEEFVFAINRARVLYWLNRHFPGDNRPLSLV